VDVDPLISGLPASQIATAGGITYMSNPTTRPAVDTYFQNWAAKSCVVNGIGTRSTSHDQSRQLVLTGSLDPDRWQNYVKLRAEIAWHARRSDAGAALAEKQRWKKIHKALRRHYKSW
jgi:hypothetical protein